MSNRNHADVIIIGTGAGGGTLAHRLAPSANSILLLERGDCLPRERENWDSRCDDRGAPGDFITAQWTLTLALPKTGLLAMSTGALFLADIGITQGAYRRVAKTCNPPFGDRFWVRLERHEARGPVA